MSSERSKKFFRDLGIYGLGVIGTRIITFLMLPLYTYFVDKSDYGYFDLCLNICLLLIPVVTLQLREGAFRFLLVSQSEDERTSIITCVYKQFFVNLLIGTIIFFFIYFSFDISYLPETAILLAVMSFHEIILQVTRGLGKNKVYATSNFLNAFFIGILSVLFIVVMKMGVEGIYLTNILARLLSIAYIEFNSHTFRHFSLKLNAWHNCKHILGYTLPLIPISMCYWVTSSCDRLFIKHFIGLEMNGLYAVAVRLTLIIQTLSIVFYQSWQETALLQYESKDRDAFFSKVFSSYAFVLTFILICYTFALKMCYGWLIEARYSESLKFIYPLGVAALLNALATSFYDLGYQCAKETKRAINAVLLTAILNLILNMLLVPRIGIWGVIVTSITCYMFMNIYRYFDTRRFFTISLNKVLLVPIAIITISGLAFYLQHNLLFDFIYILISCLILIIFSPVDKHSLVNRFFGFKKKKVT